VVEAKKSRAACGRRAPHRRPDDAPTDPASAVVLDAVLALRQPARARTLPFDFAGLRVMDALDELGTTLTGVCVKGDPAGAAAHLTGGAAAPCRPCRRVAPSPRCAGGDRASARPADTAAGGREPVTGAAIRARVEAYLEELATAAAQQRTRVAAESLRTW
jgi:hypothetical protein